MHFSRMYTAHLPTVHVVASLGVSSKGVGTMPSDPCLEVGIGYTPPLHDIPTLGHTHSPTHTHLLDIPTPPERTWDQRYPPSSVNRMTYRCLLQLVNILEKCLNVFSTTKNIRLFLVTGIQSLDSISNRVRCVHLAKSVNQFGAHLSSNSEFLSTFQTS